MLLRTVDPEMFALLHVALEVNTARESARKEALGARAFLEEADALLHGVVFGLIGLDVSQETKEDLVAAASRAKQKIGHALLVLDGLKEHGAPPNTGR